MNATTHPHTSTRPDPDQRIPCNNTPAAGAQLRTQITALINQDRNTSDICDDIQALLLTYNIDERITHKHAVELVEAGRAPNAADRYSRFQTALRYVLLELRPRTAVVTR